MVSGDAALATLRRGKSLSATKLEHLLATRRETLNWINDGQIWADLAFVELKLAAVISKADRPSSQELQRVVLTLRQGLSIKPISPDSWRWLAAARLAAGDRNTAVSALRMSWLVGPNVTYLALPRVRLSLLLWDQLASEERTLAYRQIRYAWWLAPDRLVALAAQESNLSPIRAALVEEPKDLKTFERRLRDRKPR